MSPAQHNAHRHRLARRWTEAEAAYRRLLALDPNDVEAEYLLAISLQEQGKVEAAAAAYRSLIGRAPGHVDAYNNLGVAYKAMGRLEEAVAAYREALRLRRDHAASWSNLGNALKALGRQNEAEAAYRRAIEVRPDYAEVHHSLGALLLEMERTDEAETSLRSALSWKPDYPSALNYLGMASQERDRIDEAVAFYLRALAIDPEYAEAHNNLGFAMRRLGRLDEAVARYGLALVFKPDFPQAAMNRALVDLARGELDLGWSDYRSRPLVRRDVVAAPPAPLPADLRGRTFVLLKEQGLGDELFFLRFAPLLKARGADFAIEASPKIASILRRVDGFDQILSDGVGPADGEKVFQGDLPYLLGCADSANLPPPLKLEPLPERLDRWRRRLDSVGPRPHVAVTWRGGVKGPGKLFKQAPLDRMAGVLENVAGSVMALQRQPRPGEVAEMESRLGRGVGDLTDANEDIEDVLALLALIDTYVTVSNTNVHLRAGVSASCHVVVPHPPEFRWLVEGERTPWFRDFHVYRQKADGNWDGAIAALRRDLAGLKH